MSDSNRNKGVDDSFAWCKTFRRLARRASSLPAGAGDQLAAQPKRTRLIEDVFDLLQEIDVWDDGIAQALCICAVTLYNGRDTEATAILAHLADEELRLLRSGRPAPAEDEDGEEGDSPSG